MIIRIKQYSSASWEHFSRISPRLGVVFFELARKAQDWGLKELVITSIIRPKTNDSGVHALGRGIDISTANMNQDLIDSLVEFINNRYSYDMQRPELKTAIYHSTDAAGDDGKHLHLQVAA
jgi:hypothetical protein